jgi:hypothetical protein
MARQPLFKRVREFVNPVQDVINQLVNNLFEHELKNIDETFHKLVIENQSLGGTMNVFLHDGLRYSHLPHHLIKDVKEVRELHPSLVPSMERHLTRKRNAEQDKRFVLNALSVVGQKCTTIQDMRDVLPEALVTEIPFMRNLPRMRDEGWVLDEHPQLLKQFQAAVEIILIYQVNRLLY